MSPTHVETFHKFSSALSPEYQYDMDAQVPDALDVDGLEPIQFDKTDMNNKAPLHLVSDIDDLVTIGWDSKTHAFNRPLVGMEDFVVYDGNVYMVRSVDNGAGTAVLSRAIKFSNTTNSVVAITRQQITVKVSKLRAGESTMDVAEATGGHVDLTTQYGSHGSAYQVDAEGDVEMKSAGAGSGSGAGTGSGSGAGSRSGTGAGSGGAASGGQTFIIKLPYLADDTPVSERERPIDGILYLRSGKTSKAFTFRQVFDPETGRLRPEFDPDTGAEHWESMDGYAVVK
jgi:hypothetical protein